jgi:hypothetical protein
VKSFIEWRIESGELELMENFFNGKLKVENE